MTHDKDMQELIATGAQHDRYDIHANITLDRITSKFNIHWNPICYCEWALSYLTEVRCARNGQSVVGILSLHLPDDVSD